jgi:hypothetical protein
VTDLAPISTKLANFIRLLASDKDGEVVAAARAMIRTLQGIGADVHDIAEYIEHPRGEISEADMQAILDKGIEIGVKRAGQQSRSNGGASHHVTPQFPPARDMAMHCYRNIDELRSDWEREFVTNMASWTRVRPLSPKQQAHLEKIYIKLHGRI